MEGEDRRAAEGRVSFELCSFTAYTNKWVNSDLLPGVKVDNDVLLRLITLTQDGYVQIHP